MTTVTFTSDPATVNAEKPTCMRGSEMLTWSVGHIVKPPITIRNAYPTSPSTPSSIPLSCSFDVRVCLKYTGIGLENSNIGKKMKSVLLIMYCS